MASLTYTGTPGASVGGSADVIVGNAPGQAAVGIVFELDGEDITDRVMSAESASGRDFPSSLTGTAGPGQVKLTLENMDGRWGYLNQTGQQLRIRTVESAPVDPVLIARDRFNRPDGPLVADEMGHAWTDHAGTFSVVGHLAQVQGNYTALSFSTIDTGVDDLYVQATLAQHGGSRQIGVVARFTDTSNYVRAYLDSGANEVRLQRWAAGVSTLWGTYALEPWEGMTIGLLLDDTAASVLVGGVPVIEATIPNGTATAAGIVVYHQEYEGQRPPELGDFHVFDTIATPQDGVLWTGDVKTLVPTPVPGYNVATLEAEGVLARAARPTVASPRLARAGAPTGLVVGDILARANLAHPPVALSEGSITTGPVGIDDDKALDLARELEVVEQGFMHETNEGQVDYHDAATRATASTQAWFSDTPGVGQFRFSAVEPIDHRGRIVNRVIAGVAPEAPGPITSTEAFGTSHVQMTLPTVADGDLLFVFLTASHDGGHEWLAPLWWAEHRDMKAALGLRIYSHRCNGTESGSVVRWYQHNGVEAGFWAGVMLKISNWFGTYEGIVVSDVVSGNDAPGLSHNWRRAPAAYIAVQSGIGGIGGGMRYEPDVFLPTLYEKPGSGVGTDGGIIIGSGVIQYDCGIATAVKIDCTEAEDPDAFEAISNAVIGESAVIAVRGYNGPHTKPTIEDPRQVGGDGRFVTVEDVESQDRHHSIVTHETPVLYRTEAEARGVAEGIISTYATDRPILAITFPATLDAAHRGQAINRRVGDKITVTATGSSSLGVAGEFFIEHIEHAWPDPKQWWVTWQLSPA